MDNKLYEICLERIQNLIENTNIDISYKVSTLYEVTQNDSNHRKIFWDIFSWKTIRPLIDKEG